MYRNIAETSQTPKTELSAKIVNVLNPLTIFAKSPIPGVGRVLSTLIFHKKNNIEQKNMTESTWTVCTVLVLCFVFKYQKRC